MHSQHVLHRDIKTQNILLTGEGDVQIGDFGLSTVR
jgi:serine/threonine protein kinase